MDAIPDDEWVCPECLAKQKGKKFSLSKTNLKKFQEKEQRILKVKQSAVKEKDVVQKKGKKKGKQIKNKKTKKNVENEKKKNLRKRKNKKIEEEEKEEKKNSKNKQKNANFKKPIFVNNLSNIKNSKISTIEENLSSESSKRNNNESYVPKGVFMTTEGMLEKERESKEFVNPFIVNKEKNKEDQISRNFADSKNYFRISSIHQGNALVVTGDDIVLNFPAIMLPKGAKLGETFTIEIKSLDTSFAYKNEKAMEIENIQRKYLPNDVSKEINNKK